MHMHSRGLKSGIFPCLFIFHRRPRQLMIRMEFKSGGAVQMAEGRNI
jgi:hypothetical protein